MSYTSHLIPSLTGGVSQQPHAFRSPSQGTEQINGSSHPVLGLSQRPGSEHLCKIGNVDGTNCFYHVNRRDSLEKYHILFTKNGALTIVDKAGQVKSCVKDPLVMSDYLNSTNPLADYLAVSIADATYILNKTKVATKKTTTTGTRLPEALLYVSGVDYGTDFSVSITKGGTTKVIWFRTWTAAQESTAEVKVAEKGTKQDNIAKLIKEVFTAGGPPLVTMPSHDYVEYIHDFTRQFPMVFRDRERTLDVIDPVGLPTNMDCALVGTSINFYNTNGDTTDFTITAYDSGTNTLLKVFKDSTPVATDLPQVNPTGFTIKVAGHNTKNTDDYWLMGLGEGWRECPRPGTTFEWNPYTLPAVLTKDAFGVFHLTPAVWANRVCGDDTTNPWPTFEGRTINDIFFYKDRLGFLSDENIILGRTSQYVALDFFRTTTLTKLDTDPIDLAVSSTSEVSILRHAVPFAGALLLFSDLSQFKLIHNGPLTYATATISSTTKFASTVTAKPRNVGKYVYFAGKRGAYSSVWEFEVDSTATIYSSSVDEAREITAHVPEYITGEIVNIQSSPNNHTLVCAATGSLNDLFIYNYFWNGNEKVQSAWHKWNFGAPVHGMSFDGDELTLVLQRDDGQLYLEFVNVNVDSALAGGSRSVVHLDRRVTLSSSHLTVPYTTAQTIRYINRHGKRIPANQVAYTVALGENVWAGVDFTFLYEFSQYYTIVNQQPVLSGRTTLRSYTLNHINTAFYKMNVIRGPQTWTKLFNAQYLSASDNILNDVVLETGSFRVPVTGKNDQIRVQLINDTHFPCVFQGGEVEAFFALSTQRT